MVKFKRNLLSVALVSAVGMASGQLHAQATPQQQAAAAQVEADEDEAKSADELDAVVVTGIRRGIEDAIETKQASSSIVEAISAEDIGKLPDTSIADSISRLPGLTAQRFGGRPQEINIRGFSGDFSTTLLNGREQTTPGNNRGVEFDQYPSELVGQVVVYKTQDASIFGQGLSGTVDLQTVSPLAFAERVVAVNVRADANDLEGERTYGDRFSVAYIDQFADRTVGLALGYARLNNPVQGQQFEAWGYDNGTLGGGKLYDIQNDNQRDGFVGTLEFKPNDDYRTRLDLFYSKFDREETKKGMEFGLVFGPPGQPLSRTNNSDGLAVQATFKNFRPVIRNDYNAAKDDLFSLGWNHELRLGENWTLEADVNTSSTTRDERVLETYAGLAPALPGDRAAISLNNEGYFDFDFGYDYADPNILRLTDPGGWGQDGYLKDFRVKDQIDAVRLVAERTFNDGVLSSVEFGANLTDRSKSRSSRESFLCLRACRDGAAVAIPTSFSNGASFNFGSLPGLYGYDALAALNGGIYNQVPNTNNGDINQKNWRVDERVASAFVNANFNFELGPIPVRGNVGVQAVNVEQKSTGVATFEGRTLSDPTTGGTNYTDYLPSLNLKFELPAEQLVRFGASRQLARPRMDYLRGNASYSIDRNPSRCPANDPPPCPRYQGDGGNPDLRPIEANAYDVMYEKYFGTKAYVSAGYFYKDLKTYVLPIPEQVDFSAFPPPANVPPAQIPQSPLGFFTRAENISGGYIKGYELSVSLPFDLLWEPLEGFGFVGNYSVTDSEVKPFADSEGVSEEVRKLAIPLPGLSKYVSNLSVYFERWGFSTRVSQRTRTQFIGEVQGFGGDRGFRDFNGEKVIDLQMGYMFKSGPLENLSFLLQANNLRNEPSTQTFSNNGGAPREYFRYGRTYLLGASYKF